MTAPAKPILYSQDFLSASRLIHLLDAVDAQEPATKNQLDLAVSSLNTAITSMSTGLAWKNPCVVATFSNINLTSPGSSIDGVALAVDDRFLVAGQTVGSENGIYLFKGASVSAVRAEDANSTAELNGAVTVVELGTYAGVGYRQSAADVIIGTDNVTWTQFGTLSPDATTTTKGVARIATQLEVDTGTANNLIVTPETLNAWAYRPLRYNTTIGDGSSTSITVSHNLGTPYSLIQVQETASPFGIVDAYVSNIDVNSCVINFSTAPATDTYTVVILA